MFLKNKVSQGISLGSVVKNPPADAGDTSSVPCPERCHVPQSNLAHEPQLLSLCPEPWNRNYSVHTPQLLRPPGPSTRALQQEKPQRRKGRMLEQE